MMRETLASYGEKLKVGLSEILNRRGIVHSTGMVGADCRIGSNSILDDALTRFKKGK